MSGVELSNQMSDLKIKQVRFNKVQKLFCIITIMFFPIGVFSLFIHAGLMIFYGNHLSNKATSLAKTKYPYIMAGPTGKGWGWDPYLIDEAFRENDTLTVEILKHNFRTVLYFGIALIGYIAMWILFSFFK